MAASPRARILMLTAVLTVTAAGAAFFVLRPEARPRPLVWRDQVAEPAGQGAAGGILLPAGSSAAGPVGATGGPGEIAARPAGTRARQPVGAASTATAPAPPLAAAATTPGSGAGNGAQPVAPAAETAGWRMLPKAPIGGRVGHTAVWTGREMLIWGGAGDLDSDPLTDGAAYDPATDRWRAVPPAPLTARFDPAAVWTGQEVLIFGGTSASGDILADGAAWNPASNAWRPLPSSPLGPRDGAVVAWAGDRLVVWSGATVPPAGSDGPSAGEMPDHGGSEMPADGSAYVPASDRWIPVPAAPIPGRSGAESVWTGTRLVVAGGYHEGDDDDRTDGAAFDPVRGVWSPIAPRPAPASCGGEAPCDGVWTGTAALFPASGVVYDPVTDRWSALAPYPPEQGPLSGEPAVWTGRRLLAWGSPGGGSSDAAGSGADSADGGEADADIAAAPPAAGMYDPGADRWQALAPGPLSGRVLHSAIWTGQEMLIWGGTAGDAGLADGAAFRPGD